MSAEGANLSHMRGGKVKRAVTYLDRGRALADLGLSQEADSVAGAQAEAIKIELEALGATVELKPSD